MYGGGNNPREKQNKVVIYCKSIAKTQEYLERKKKKRSIV